MKVNINGQLFTDSSLDYNRIHQLVNDNTYNSVGEAVLSKISDAIHHSEWYQVEPRNFDLVNNFQDVQLICKHNFDCYLDSLIWSTMNKTELTKDIYKFILDREYVIRAGFKNNFWPKDHLHHVLDLIDWHFILDCISWFF